MSDTLYDSLGVPMDATSAQIRAAYRRLVLKYHPDQAGPHTDVQAFHEITKAYEVLSDPARRAEYDRLLSLRSKPRIPTKIPHPPPRAESTKTKPEKDSQNPDPIRLRAQIAEDLSRLIRLYGKGAIVDAQRLAREILLKDPRQPTPYAILGDLARAKGDLAEAAKMYAFAAQMDPRNPAYQRKHEELLGRLNSPGQHFRNEKPSEIAPTISFCLVLVAGAYVALAQEPPVFRDYAWISTWTFGLMVMLFLAGVCVGAGLSLGALVDRFESLSSNAVNRISPALALASIAIVNFWAAAILYALIGARERSYTYSISRLFAASGTALLIMAGAASASHRIESAQVLIWGGNLIYIGSVCGWMVADTLRE